MFAFWHLILFVKWGIFPVHVDVLLLPVIRGSSVFPNYQNLVLFAPLPRKNSKHSGCFLWAYGHLPIQALDGPLNWDLPWVLYWFVAFSKPARVCSESAVVALFGMGWGSVWKGMFHPYRPISTTGLGIAPSSIDTKLWLAIIRFSLPLGLICRDQPCVLT